MTENLFNEISKWQKETFGKANAFSKLAHLKDEIEELIADLKSNNPNRRLEFADCFFLLFGAAAADGMSFDDIVKAIEEKFEINKKRKWGTPQENGVVNHVSDDDLTRCTGCDKRFDIETMTSDDDENWFCEPCWTELAPVMLAEYNELCDKGEIEPNYTEEIELKKDVFYRILDGVLVLCKNTEFRYSIGGYGINKDGQPSSKSCFETEGLRIADRDYIEQQLIKCALIHEFDLVNPSKIISLHKYTPEAEQVIYPKQAEFVFNHKRNRLWLTNNCLYPILVFDNGTWAKIELDDSNI